MGTQIGNTNQTEELTPLSQGTNEDSDAVDTHESHAEVSWSEAP